MARPADRTPPGPRRVLSAVTLVQPNTSLRPFIVTRGGSSYPAEPTRYKSLPPLPSEPQASVHPSTPRGNMSDHESRPRNRYDQDDVVPTAFAGRGHSRAHQLGGAERDRLGFRDVVPAGAERRDVGLGEAAVPVAYHGVAANKRARKHAEQPTGILRVRRVAVKKRPRVSYSDSVWLRPSSCYIFLKVLEVLTGVTVVVVSRMGFQYLTYHAVYTVYGALALLFSFVSVLLLCEKGHPTPNECCNVMILLCYVVAVPMLFCGAIMVLLSSGTHQYVYVLAGLFFGGGALFSLDLLVMAVAILQCYCCGWDPHSMRRLSKTHPDPENDYDFYYVLQYRGHPQRNHHRQYRHHKALDVAPSSYRHGNMLVTDPPIIRTFR